MHLALFVSPLWLSLWPQRFLAALGPAPEPEKRRASDLSEPDCPQPPSASKCHRVTFSLEGLLDFQAIQRVAAEGGGQGSRPPASNFRIRPSYDNSKRELTKIQNDRQSCPTQLWAIALNVTQWCRNELSNLHWFLIGFISDLISRIGFRHATNGPSRHRLDRLLSLSQCRCPQQRCFSKFKDFGTREKLSRFLSIFWDMRKGWQDAYVHGSASGCNFEVCWFKSMPNKIQIPWLFWTRWIFARQCCWLHFQHVRWSAKLAHALRAGGSGFCWAIAFHQSA